MAKAALITKIALMGGIVAANGVDGVAPTTGAGASLECALP